MDSSNYSLQAQGIIQKAYVNAEKLNHRTVETGHILKALINSNDSIVNDLLGKMGKNSSDIDYHLDNMMMEYPKSLGDDLYFSLDANKALRNASEFAKEMDNDLVSPAYIMVGIASIEHENNALLMGMGITGEELKTLLKDLKPGAEVKVKSLVPSENLSFLDKTNLNTKAVHGRLKPVAGRNKEINNLMEVLTRLTKNNPLLIGDPGVGKTAVVEGLAQLIVRGKVPEDFKLKQIVALDMTGIKDIGGAEIRQSLKRIVETLIEEKGRLVLFLDDIHEFIETDNKDFVDGLNMIRSAVLSGDIQVIAATTIQKYHEHDDWEKIFGNNFQPIQIPEPDSEDAISMLRSLKQDFEKYHKVFITDEAIVAAVDLSARFITDCCLPEKAIDIIDEAAARIHLEMETVPAEIIEMEQRIGKLEVHRKMKVAQADKKGSVEISKEISELQEEFLKLKNTFQLEKSIYKNIQVNRQMIGKLRKKANQAEDQKDFIMAAEIRNNTIREYEDKIAELQKKLAKIQEDSSMINADVTRTSIAEIISKRAGISVKKILLDENKLLLQFEKQIHNRIVGQHEAVTLIAEVIRRRKAGLHDMDKPIGSFLFVGIPGTGKTETAKALCEILYGSEKFLIQVNMSEYHEENSLAIFMDGSSGEFIGTEKDSLIDSVIKKPYSVVLLKSIEKAHSDVILFLRQLLNLGYAFNSQGRTVSFKNVVVIMTTEIGINAIREKFTGEFKTNHNMLYEETKDMVKELIMRKLSYDFTRSVDELILFKPLQKEELRLILERQYQKIKEIAGRQKVRLRITDSALDWLTEEVVGMKDEAHSIGNLLQKHILNELAEKILEGRLAKGDDIVIETGESGIVLQKAHGPES